MSLLFNNQLPDIDKVIQEWVNKFFKKDQSSVDDDLSDDDDTGGDFKPRMPNFSRNAMSAILTLACFVILCIYVVSGFFTVNSNEKVVVFRLGSPIDVRGPGLRWHYPLIDSYRVVNLTEVRRVEIGYSNDTNNKDLRESLMLTSDLNIIDMQFAVQYDLDNPEDFIFNNRFASANARDVVKQASETAMREIVGRSKIDFVLYEGRESIADETRLLIQKILDRYDTGISIKQVAIQNVQPPDQVQNAFEDAIKARQDRERKINEGQAYANDILPRARGQSERIIKDAEAYKASKVFRATGESERFTLLAKEYALAPAVTHRRLYLETVETVFQRANKIIIDENASEGNLIYLPLDKLVNPSGNNSRSNAGGQLTIPLGETSTSSDSSSVSDFKQRLRDYTQ